MLLSGAVPCPEWASSLVQTLETCTGLPGTRKWIDDREGNQSSGYAFASPKGEGSTPSFLTKKKGIDFPPGNWGKRKNSGSYFAGEHSGSGDFGINPSLQDDYDRHARQSRSGFDTKFESDFAPPSQGRHRPFNSISATPNTNDQFDPASPFNSLPPFSTAHSGLSTTHSRTNSTPLTYSSGDHTNPFASTPPPDDNFFESDIPPSPRGPFIKPKPDLSSPLAPGEGVGRAIALYDFHAVEVRNDFLS